MTVGSPTVDSFEGAKSQPGLRYTCLQTPLTRGYETPDFPREPCPGGIMAIHHFPAFVVLFKSTSLSFTNTRYIQMLGREESR